MKASMRVLVILLLTGLLITATAVQALSADKKLRICSVVPVGTHHDDFCRHFAKLVNDAKVGLNIQVVSGTALGNAPQVMDQVVQGTVAMMGNDMAWVAPFDLDLKILNWGYAFRDQKHQGQFWESALFSGILERIRKKHGVRVLAAWGAQSRLIFAKRPFTKIEDVKNLKIRVPQIKEWVETWKVFGGNPTPLNFHEVYLALKTGVIEAAGGQAGPSYQYNYHKAAKYIMKMGHILPGSFIAINETRFQALTKEQQGTIIDAVLKTKKWAFGEAIKDEELTLKKMIAEGSKVIRVDASGFQKASAQASTRMEEEGHWSKGFFEKIQAIK